MAKVKSVFFCQSCGHESPKWLGKCPSCNSWNSFTEERMVQTKSASAPAGLMRDNNPAKAPQPTKLQDIANQNEVRINTGDEELNRILGGGMVPGSLILL